MRTGRRMSSGASPTHEQAALCESTRGLLQQFAATGRGTGNNIGMWIGKNIGNLHGINARLHVCMLLINNDICSAIVLQSHRQSLAVNLLVSSSGNERTSHSAPRL